MANWSNPTLTSNYVNFVNEVKDRDDDIARQFDPAHTSATNVPTNAIRYNGSANRWERWNGTAWSALASAYAIDITGNAATATTAGTTTGNAGTATTLQTARTINGTSFNGSANITTANWGTARTLTIGSTGKSVNGSANVSWTLAEIGALSSADGVTLAGAQTITGEKTFSADTKVHTTVFQLGAIEIHRDGSGDRNSFVDFHSHGAPNANDFSARILRNPGADGTLLIQNTGGGQIAFSGATYAFSGVAMPAPVGSAPLYMCRAWVNFDGTTTTPTIRASGNVSSVTKTTTGQFVVNFSTAMPDANYSVSGSAGSATTAVSNSSFGHLHIQQNTASALQTGSVAVHTGFVDGNNTDYPVNTVAIFR